MKNRRFKKDPKVVIDRKIDPKQKKLHEYLYQFTLKKLLNLIDMKYFSFFFCKYFKDVIIKKGRAEQNKTMVRHYLIYVDALNILLE
jgi:hypothetical protein